MPRTTDKILTTGLALTTIAASLTVIDPVWAVESTWWGAFKAARGAEVAPRADWFDGDDDDTSDKKPYAVEDGIAILNLSGVMTKQAYWWTGATGTVKLRNLLRLCLQDADVRGVLLIVCSPGGQVAGTSDLAADIALVGAQKPLIAFIEDMGCSAAYWAASQAPDGVYCNQTATVGSIGTIMEMSNWSQYYAEQGITTEQFTTGKYKGAGSPAVPMTDEWRAYFGDYVRAINASFVASVQTARKLSDAKMTQVREAGVFVGQQAVAMGLVDGISTIDAVKATLKRKAAARTGMANRAPKAETDTEDTIRMEGVDAFTGERMTLVSDPSLPKRDGPQWLPRAGNSPLSSSPEAHAGNQPVADTIPPATGANAGADTLPPQHHNTMPALAGRGTNMKNVLVNTLSALGLKKMAVAVVGVQDEKDVQAMAHVMAEQVKTEVEERVANHPLVQGCMAAGIESVADLGRVLEMKALGERALADLKADAKAHCIRAYGADTGVRISAQVATMDYSSVKMMRDAWQAEADKKFELDAETGKSAGRQTAPAPLPVSQNAEADPAATAPKTLWEQLSAEQRKTGLQLGMNTPEKQEVFAKQYLNIKSGN